MPRTKGARDISHRIRHSLGAAMDLYKEKSGKEVAEGLADEMVEHGPSTILARMNGFFPKEIKAEVTQSIEDFVTGTVSSQHDSSEESQLH